jgi:hypothetical protein
MPYVALQYRASDNFVHRQLEDRRHEAAADHSRALATAAVTLSALPSVLYK